MRRKIIAIMSLVPVMALCGCQKESEQPEEQLKEAVDYGDAGIYRLDGDRIISYETIVDKYHYDIAKDYEPDNDFGALLDKMGIDETVKFVLPDVKRIGSYAFCQAENLGYVVFPDILESIGSYAFYCSGIKEAVLPSGVAAVENNAFDSCQYLALLQLNEGLKIIDTSAFRYTPCLTELTLPDSVETIGSCAFQETGLEYVYIPNVINLKKNFTNTYR